VPVYNKRLSGGDGKGNVSIQRYKSLGEASKLFDELTGHEVEPRRRLIGRNAKYVTNLDV
jgi:DNA gyrase/topoisomerase IV subunit B